MPKPKRKLARYRVVVSDFGKEDLLQIEPKARRKILEKLKMLESNPFPTTKPIKKIKLSRKIPLFRLRALGYRIIFHVRDNTVIILAVIHRSRLEAAINKVITRTITDRQ